ncbi:hypothetical protein QFZ78_000812 [Paenibacillus sp. V4I5]|nr:hypothetical protein [Paenibacillus sp. V4I5]
MLHSFITNLKSLMLKICIPNQYINTILKFIVPFVLKH